MIIAYDGTNYCGWQIQPNATSIQEIVQSKIKTILRHDINLIGSGRTDTGVHAAGQVAHFKSPQKFDLYRMLGSLNGMLPRDIRIMNIEEAPLNFHAQHSAESKTYHYHICLEKVQNPFQRLYSLHVRENADIELLKQAARLFIGTHDFTSFANEAHTGSAAQNPIRTIKRLDVVEEKSGLRLEFQANGFLYKMVRNITGTLIEVSLGKIRIEDIPKIIHACDRRLAGQAAAPHGLFLFKVDYP
jgi:tRNA pseudouridine38-40 synthase